MKWRDIMPTKEGAKRSADVYREMGYKARVIKISPAKKKRVMKDEPKHIQKMMNEWDWEVYTVGRRRKR